MSVAIMASKDIGGEYKPRGEGVVWHNGNRNSDGSQVASSRYTVHGFKPHNLGGNSNIQSQSRYTQQGNDRNVEKENTFLGPECSVWATWTYRTEKNKKKTN